MAARAASSTLLRERTNQTDVVPGSGINHRRTIAAAIGARARVSNLGSADEALANGPIIVKHHVSSPHKLACETARTMKRPRRCSGWLDLPTTTRARMDGGQKVPDFILSVDWFHSRARYFTALTLARSLEAGRRLEAKHGARANSELVAARAGPESSSHEGRTLIARRAFRCVRWSDGQSGVHDPYLRGGW